MVRIKKTTIFNRDTLSWYNPHVISADEKPSIPIAVISDGKPGHENQSLGIAEHIPGSEILLLSHKLTEGFQETLLRLQVRFSLSARSDPRRILSRIFPSADIDRLINHSPRAIITAGTLSAGPCILAGALTGAKTCICMRPSLLPLSMFDLAVLPTHDNPPDKPDIVRTLAAPNRVSPQRLTDEAEQWRDELPAGDRIISWIIGGPSASAEFSENHVCVGLIETLKWATGNDWQVWLSTSRRTPETLESDIATIAGEFPALAWKLLWHRDQRNPLYAMFHRSRLAIVTSDSVSMIAEAASAGKGPLVYQADRIARTTPRKQDRMVEALINAGYGNRAADQHDILDTMARMLEKTDGFPALDDAEKAAQKLLALINS